MPSRIDLHLDGSKCSRTLDRVLPDARRSICTDRPGLAGLSPIRACHAAPQPSLPPRQCSLAPSSSTGRVDGHAGRLRLLHTSSTPSAIPWPRAILNQFCGKLVTARARSLTQPRLIGAISLPSHLITHHHHTHPCHFLHHPQHYCGHFQVLFSTRQRRWPPTLHLIMSTTSIHLLEVETIGKPHEPDHSSSALRINHGLGCCPVPHLTAVACCHHVQPPQATAR